jgi:hypothetical protein
VLRSNSRPGVQLSCCAVGVDDAGCEVDGAVDNGVSVAKDGGCVEEYADAEDGVMVEDGCGDDTTGV